MAVTFDQPVPGPNVPHFQTTVVTGNVDGNSPQCSVVALIQPHPVLPAFAVGLGGAFQVTIAAGQLQDNNLYRLTVWSEVPGSTGSIQLDTRPVG